MSMEEELRRIINLQDRLIELLGDQVCSHYENRSREEIQDEEALWEELARLKGKLSKQN